MSNNVSAARKMLRGWPMISTVLFIPAAYYGTSSILISELQRLQAGAAVVSVHAGAVFFPYVFVFAIFALASAILRAIPASPATLNQLGRCANFLMLAGLPLLLFVVLLARPLQEHYMPKLGYFECGLLHGNPTLWFTDWIKNPAWCVKGKDRDWVFEQAKLAEEKSANPSSAIPSAPAKP
jgi:nitric oxide reductase large subunit